MYLVFDMGATHTRLATSSDGIKLDEIIRFDTDPTAAGFGKLLGAADSFINGRTLQAIAGGFPGQIDANTGELVHANNLPEWEGLPVRERIEKLFDCRVVLANDVVLAGLGESRVGAGQDIRVMAYYTVSTGVNAVRIVNGHIDMSIVAYKLGEQLLPGKAGKPETLEWLVGGAALQSRHPQLLSGRHDWKAEAKHLAQAVYNTAIYWTPEVIVFGGSMMRDIKLADIEAELSKLSSRLDVMPVLKRAELADTAALNGALALLRKP